MDKEKIEMLKAYLESKLKKHESIQLQQFEAAAAARDVERELSISIYYKYINEDSDPELKLEYSFFDNELSKYFLEEYNIRLVNLTQHSIKTLIRKKNLDDLGI